MVFPIVLLLAQGIGERFDRPFPDLLLAPGVGRLRRLMSVGYSGG